MILKPPQWVIDLLLMVDRKHVLSAEGSVGTSNAETAAELRTIIDELKVEAFATEKGTVNYRGLKDSQTYKIYKDCVGKLKRFDLSFLSSREEQLAFWINMYNSLIIDAVIHFGIQKSVWEAGWGFFRKAAYNIGGLRYSADDIEHGILRGNRPHPLLHLRQFAKNDPRLTHIVKPVEPRTHFTLVCASQSCPLITVYHADEIEVELDGATKTFINAGGVVAEPGKEQVSLSRIFSWYQGDFGGRSGVLEFILDNLREGPEKDYLQKNTRRVRIKYQKYNWSLNLD